MYNDILVKFSTTIRKSYQFSTDVFEYFWGFIPDKTACESITVDNMQSSKFTSIDERIRTQIVILLSEISTNYPEIVFGDPNLINFRIEHIDGGDYWIGFVYEVNVAYKVKFDSNLSDGEIIDMVHDLVMERCEMHLT